MLKCKKCKRQTKSGEPTGSFIFYKKNMNANNIEEKNAIGELKTCMQCSGSEVQ